MAETTANNGSSREPAGYRVKTDLSTGDLADTFKTRASNPSRTVSAPELAATFQTHASGTPMPVFTFRPVIISQNGMPEIVYHDPVDGRPFTRNEHRKPVYTEHPDITRQLAEKGASLVPLPVSFNNPDDMDRLGDAGSIQAILAAGGKPVFAPASKTGTADVFARYAAGMTSTAMPAFATSTSTHDSPRPDEAIPTPEVT